MTGSDKKKKKTEIIEIWGRLKEKIRDNQKEVESWKESYKNSEEIISKIRTVLVSCPDQEEIIRSIWDILNKRR